MREAVIGEKDILIGIGPEGDFSDGEIDGATAVDTKLVSLGEYTLRSEVAAATALTLIQYELGVLGPGE